MIGAAELALMRPSACVINTARGGIVDEKALIAALTAGGFAARRSMSSRTEPPAADNPLFTLDNVILSPHSAGLTVECAERMAIASVENVLAGIDRQAGSGRGRQSAGPWQSDSRLASARWRRHAQSRAERATAMRMSSGRSIASPSSRDAATRRPSVSLPTIARCSTRSASSVALSSSLRSIGTDNSATLNAIAELGENFRGVAVLPPDVGDRVLADCAAGGIRGVRLSDMTAGGVPLSHLEAMAARMKGLGLAHPDLRRVLQRHRASRPHPQARRAVVIDHFGVVDPERGVADAGFQAILASPSRRRLLAENFGAVSHVAPDDALSPTSSRLRRRLLRRRRIGSSGEPIGRIPSCGDSPPDDARCWRFSIAGLPTPRSASASSSTIRPRSTAFRRDDSARRTPTRRGSSTTPTRRSPASARSTSCGSIRRALRSQALLSPPLRTAARSSSATSRQARTPHSSRRLPTSSPMSTVTSTRAASTSPPPRRTASW